MMEDREFTANDYLQQQIIVAKDKHEFVIRSWSYNKQIQLRTKAFELYFNPTRIVYIKDDKISILISDTISIQEVMANAQEDMQIR